jgi:hypothetical protein
MSITGDNSMANAAQQFHDALTDFLVASKDGTITPLELRTRLVNARAEAKKLDVASYDAAVFEAFQSAGLSP